MTVHFNKRTAEDYLSEAYKKVCKIHRQLPEGGILVFVTGQQEVNVFCKKLQRTFSQSSSKLVQSNDNEEESVEEKSEIQMLKKLQKKSKIRDINLDELVVFLVIHFPRFPPPSLFLISDIGKP